MVSDLIALQAVGPVVCVDVSVHAIDSWRSEDRQPTKVMPGECQIQNVFSR